MKTERQWFTVSVPVGTGLLSEAVRLALQETGIEPRQYSHTLCRGKGLITVYLCNRRAAVGVERAICRHSNGRVRAEVAELDANWKTAWKRDFRRPVRLAPGLRVVPQEVASEHRRLPGDILIDTETTFGTGLHPTTRFMAGFVAGLSGRYRDLFDIGCGTGILLAVAHRRGCRHLSGIDYDPAAVAVCRRNLRANRCRGVFVRQADVHRLRPRRQYDLVCANLLSTDLLRSASILSGLVRPEKYLALSGIGRENVPEILRTFRAVRDCRCVGRRSDREWAALLFQMR